MDGSIEMRTDRGKDLGIRRQRQLYLKKGVETLLQPQCRGSMTLIVVRFFTHFGFGTRTESPPHHSHCSATTAFSGGQGYGGFVLFCPLRRR